MVVVVVVGDGAAGGCGGGGGGCWWLSILMEVFELLYVCVCVQQWRKWGLVLIMWEEREREG